MFSKKHLPRWRAFSLLAVHLLFAVHVLHWKLKGQTLAPLEFSESLYTVHDGVITAGFVFTAAAVLGTLLFGRYFCGWGCHILALQDLCAWLLAKFRIKVKPIRSRAMAWIPLATFAYLFLWPQLDRILAGRPQPPLVIQAESQGWSSFVTSDLLRAMPGPVLSALTLVVCGFLIVYFLGSRSFCYSICPYGVFLGWADRLSPAGRIVLTGACENCGLCTVNCKSGVKVIQEIRQFGSVVDKNCLKSMDCISGCPNTALGVGTAWPALLARRKAKPPAGKVRETPAVRKYSFTVGEEAVFSLAFAALALTYRGLYGIGILLALGIAVLGGFAAVLCVRSWKRIRVPSAIPAPERNGGEPNPAPRGWVRPLAWAAGIAFLLLSLHSAFIRYHVHAGQRALAGCLGGGPSASESLSACAESSRHLESSLRWGLAESPPIRKLLASTYARQGDFGKSQAAYFRYLERNPGDAPVRKELASMLTAEGRLDEALDQILGAIVPDNSLEKGVDRNFRAGARTLAAQLYAAKSDTSRALEQLRLAVEDNSHEPSHYCNFLMLALKREDWKAYGHMLARGKSIFGSNGCLSGFPDPVRKEAVAESREGLDLLNRPP